MLTRVVRAKEGVSSSSTKSKSCSCTFDPKTGACCSTAMCGCRKRNKACSDSCCCARPVCYCKDGNKMAVLREVEKEGPNRGRKFFGCGNSQNARCDFFAWVGRGLCRTLDNPESNESWHCLACTYMNNSNANECEICSLKRPDLSNSEKEYCSPCTNQFGKVEPIAPTNDRTAKNSSKNTRKRRKCSLGASCPYISEYQHSLEYSHDEEEDSDRAAGKGGSGSGGFVPFRGVGHKLSG